MGYIIKKKGYIELKPELLKEVVKLRSEIEENAQHRGKNYEICLAAYTAIREAHGHPAPNSSCRSGCIRQMNKILCNWFKNFDAHGGRVPSDQPTSPSVAPSTNEAINAESNGNLIPIETRRATLMDEDYDVIKESYLFKFNQEEYKKLNNGRKASKEAKVNKLLGV